MSKSSVVPSADEVRAWPVTVDVPAAGRCWGLGRDAAYDLARAGTFPVPVLRLGTALRVTRASILYALGISDTVSVQPTPLHAPSKGAFSQLQGPASDAPLDARGPSEAA